MEEQLRILVSIAAAIVLEAMPFLAAGSLLSAIVEVCVSSERLVRLVPRSTLGRIGMGIGAGVVLPTCECGVVPVARRLLRKGLPASTTLAYLIAAPILNPIVLISTYVAFRGELAMVGGRAGVAGLVAFAVGWLMRGQAREQVLRDSAAPHGGDHDHAAHTHGGHAHDGHAHDGHAHDHGRFRAVLHHAADDFLTMGAWLILGSLAAATLKVLMPPETFGLLEANQVVAIGGMMALAVALSVCSEADAFVAASFVTLPAIAHLAFITIGPMVDLKLIGLYLATFRRRTVWILLLVPTVLVFATCMLLGVWW